MVKFGKSYRELQILEFKKYYIDYKKLKQKIKQIQQALSSESRNISIRSDNESLIKSIWKISLKEEEYSPNISMVSLSEDKCGELLIEFKNLFDEEFQRCYSFFKRINQQLHRKLNGHLYTQTNYSSYNIEKIIEESNNLKTTIYLAKCLNDFIHDNMMALKKILKKFDKKFNIYFGNFGPKYILDNLCKENSDLENLLQFKIIDEANCIIESNLKLLKEYYLELIDIKKINKEEDQFFKIYYKICNYLIDIDDLIYFKIQYKEWFYFIKKNSVIKTESTLYKNLMFNPILFSAYHKDGIMNKLLSSKAQHKELEKIQIPMTCQNKVNILMIFFQTFFYNTLISGIYPLQFIYIKDIEINWGKEYSLTEYSFLLISSTYICSYFSIMIYHCFGAKRIKLSYIISNIFFLIGSLFYIISYNGTEHVSFVFGFLITARIFVGFGANPLMGKKYILSYAPKFYLPLISKYYVFITILGHSMGPFFVFLFFVASEAYEVELFSNFYYSNYNCIGWYGTIISFLLIFAIIFFFTSPKSKQFRKSKSNYLINSKTLIENNPKMEYILDDDDNNDESKEFYKHQKEMIEIYDTSKDMDITNTRTFKKTNTIIRKDNKFKEKNEKNKDNENNKDNDNDNGNDKIILQKSFSFNDNDFLDTSNSIEHLDNKQNSSIIKIDSKEVLNINEELESGNFVNINMIPRAINDLMKQEKKVLSYLNTNLLIILIILFFCNLLKENCIAYSSYFIYNKNKEMKDEDEIKIFIPKFLCLSISISYIIEMFSMFFIQPLYRINNKLKKILVILMIISISLMIPICFEINLLIYFIIITVVILLSSIIEVVSSSYLAYLTPPEWKMFHINAGSLPFYIMNFGKLLGCLICCVSLAEKHFIPHLNNFIVMIITFIGYAISCYYILRSDNFRVKAICRLMRKKELDLFN